jgi:uncharacterized membrane protein
MILRRSLLSFTIFLALLVLLTNIQSLYFNCLNAIDFGIYLQAVYGIGEGDFNPFLTVRNLKFFNDHFDPIVFIPALVNKLLGPSPFLLIVSEWAAICTFSLVVYVVTKKKFNSQTALIATLITLLNKPILVALRFPVHPVTWTGALTIILIYGIYYHKHWHAFFASQLLFLFKESYPFATLGLSFYYLIKKEWKYFFLFSITALLELLFVFKGRALLFGPTYNYQYRLLSGLNESVFDFIWFKIRSFDYKIIFKNYYPLILLLFVHLYQERKNLFKVQPLWGVLLYAAPLLGIHYLANSFAFHYGAIFAPMIIGVLIFSGMFEWLSHKRIYLPLFLLLSFSNSFSEIEKMSAQLFFQKNKQCVVNPTKIKDIKELLTQTLVIPPGKKIVITGGLFNRVLTPEMKLYQIGGYSSIPETFEYLALETHPEEHNWPLSHEEIKRIKNTCSLFAKNVIVENDYYFLAKGNFIKSCIYKE